MSNAGYAVVDVETTGLFPGRHDRIIEIGVVLVDREGRQVDEWGTLVNPARDLGPQHIHGIQSRDVIRAPRFAEIAGDLAARLSGRIVVAHNLNFDLRFLKAEYDRIDVGTPLDFDHGLCTMALSGQYLESPSRSLVGCCASAGIGHKNPHSALHDARACAELFAFLIDAAGRPEPWQHLFATQAWPNLLTPCGRTARRTLADAQPQAFLERLVDRLPRVPQPLRADEYLALLDRALLDRRLSASEQDGLIEVADTLALTYSDVLELHRDYLAALAQIAWSDGIVTDDEHLDLRNVANLLGLAEQDVAIALRRTSTAREAARWGQFHLRPGDVVAFTGQMTGQRDEWEHRALQGGLKVTGNGVTKRTTVLVAADPDSQSGKASKARQYGIPIITPDAFSTLVEQMRS
jgi:DNA polymerase-3 subunit epsilon